jgi:chemotaxis protein CheZ
MQPLDQELARRLDELRDETVNQVSWTEIRDVVENVLSTMEGDLSTKDVNLFTEIQSLSKYIEATKQGLREIQPEAIPGEHIPVAQDELDAVTQATEEATVAIMEATEDIESTAGKIDEENAAVLDAAVTKIYEACGFQDITGQRITKVVKALQSIEEKVEELIATFGDDVEAKERVRLRKEAQAAAAAEEVDPDLDLLHGPQMATEAASQDDIDALFD